MDVVFVVITNIVTTKKEVKESKQLKESSSFDILIGDPKCESVLELTLATE